MRFGCAAKRLPLPGMMFDRRPYEAGEERMWPVRLALEFGVKLAANEVRMARELDHFDQAVVRRDPTED